MAVSELRLCMKSCQYCSEPLAAYIIPTDDSHQSEYIADCDKRREYVSGFTGSAGVAVVTPEEALLWTDGRYHLQASRQLRPADKWTLMRTGNQDVPSVEEWLSRLPSGSAVGFDPQLTSEASFLKYSKLLEHTGQALLPLPVNLVDVVWADSRPPRPNQPISVLPLQYAGQSWQDKLQRVREKLSEEGAEALVITALDEVAWLFNLRGSDVEFNPVFFAYSIVTLEQAMLFVDAAQLSAAVKGHLCVGEEEGVRTLPYHAIAEQLTQLQRKVWVNSASSLALCRLVPAQRRVAKLSPIQLLKAVKNSVELQGMRNCHVRDSAAVCEYLHWLEAQVPSGRLTEVTAAVKLETLRREQPNFVSLSFSTISSSGPNGAVIHYRPSLETARLLTTEELYLCDSGAQYLDGTTDVTRTVHFGQPSDREKECFTLVLKGHIALSSAVFPEQTMGNRLDTFARAALWRAGLDYKHGTGHGVGAFLNVHEGPHGIGSTRECPAPMEAHMTVTDEPGYYEDGKFGIRIENVCIVQPVETKNHFAGKQFLTLEPITLVPIQLKMLEPSLLTEQEVCWLDAYHQRVLREVGGYLQECGKTEVLQWLRQQTPPLA